MSSTALLTLLLRYEELRERGEQVTPEELCRDSPGLLQAFRSALEHLQEAGRRLGGGGPAPEASPSAPDTVPGYEIEGELGRGGMGVVYRARQVALNRTVALKMVRDAGAASHPELRRLAREAELVAGLDHPNIVPVYEVGTHNGLPYFAMKLLEGGSLRQKMEHYRDNIPETARLIAAVARAVHHAHQRQLIHRDLKPDNVLLEADGRPCVGDFGLARRFDPGASGDVSGVVGTPAYMAPEQARGEKALTTAADVYSVGAILYECLAGRPPFKGENLFDTLMMVLESPPVSPRLLNPSVDADLETVCLKCLEKEPRKRYASAAELADDLERWLRREPVQARPVGWLERTARWCRRHPVVAALLALVVMLAGGALAGGVAFTLQLDEARRQAGREADDARAARDQVKGALAAAQTRKEQADQARKEESAQRQKAQHALYVNSVGLAQREWQAGNVDRARALLASCPPAQRDWEWHYLDNLCHTEVLTYEHPGGEPIMYLDPGGPRTVNGAYRLDVSPDGQKALSLASGGSNRLWEVETGRTLHALPADVTDARFSPAGGTIALIRGSRSVVLIDAETARPVATVASGLGSVRHLAFSGDGKRLAAATRDDKGRWEARAWEAPGGKEVGRFALPGGAPNYLFFSDDGQTLVTAGPSSFESWDFTTGKPRWRKKPLGFLWSVDPAGGALVSAGDNVLIRWGLSDGRFLVSLGTGKQQLTQVAFSPAGGLATGGARGTVRFWDDRFRPRDWIAGPGRVDQLAFTPDGARLLTAHVNRAAGRDRAVVRVWDIARGQTSRALRGSPYRLSGLAVSPDGRHAFTWGAAFRGMLDMDARIWGLEAGACRFVVPNGPGLGFTQAGCFSPDGRTLALLSEAGLTLRGPGTGKLIRLLAPGFDSHHALAFSPRGEYLVTCGLVPPKGGLEEHGPQLFDARTGRLVKTFPLPDGKRPAEANLALSPDGTRLVARFEKSLVAWEFPSGRVLWAVPEKGPRSDVVFGPDGKHFYLAGWSSDVRMHQAASGKLVRTYPGPAQGNCAVAVHPRGHRLAITRGDSIHVLDSRTGEELLVLEGHEGGASKLMFTTDGNRLVSVGGDAALRIWEAGPWSPSQRLAYHRRQADQARLNWLLDALKRAGPRRPFLMPHLARLLSRMEKSAKADPEQTRLLADTWASLGEAARAHSAYAQLAERPGELGDAIKAALLGLAAGKPDAHGAARRSLLDRAARTSSPEECLQAAWASALSPGEADTKALRALVSRARKLGYPDGPCNTAEALVLYRAGRFKEAVGPLKITPPKKETGQPSPIGSAFESYIRYSVYSGEELAIAAMCRHKLGQADEAVELLRFAEKSPRAFPAPAEWAARVSRGLLLAEAKRVLGEK